MLFQGSIFPNIISNMSNWGFFLYLFPFLLALAIFYGVLSFAAKDQLPKSARGLISVIFAFFVMLYASANPGIVQFFASLTGTGLIVATGLLFIIILLGVAGVPITHLVWGDKSNAFVKWGIILILILIGIILFTGANVGGFIQLPTWISSSEFFTVLFFIFIIAIAVWWLGNEGEAAPKVKEEKK